jgi:hypothetical protein
MNGDDQQSVLSQPHLPKTIVESMDHIKEFALQTFAQEIAQKQLYYHTYEHIRNVQRRSGRIFDAICSASAQVFSERSRLLLDLCAIAHDMLQVFNQKTPDHTARKRESGVSEIATIERLLQYIHNLNQNLALNSPARLTDEDIEVIRVAIAATTCTFDPTSHVLYQPYLYESKPLPIEARILALADIGALGIDGIEVYNQEGSLLFLEENLDVVPLLREGSIASLEKSDPMLYENVRQRLIKRCQFQVSFAESRLARFKDELKGFPEESIPVLVQDVFKYLTLDTIRELQATTPTDENTSLGVLLRFFQFERYV